MGVKERIQRRIETHSRCTATSTQTHRRRIETHSRYIAATNTQKLTGLKLTVDSLQLTQCVSNTQKLTDNALQPTHRHSQVHWRHVQLTRRPVNLLAQCSTNSLTCAGGGHGGGRGGSTVQYCGGRRGGVGGDSTVQYVWWWTWWW